MGDPGPVTDRLPRVPPGEQRMKVVVVGGGGYLGRPQEIYRLLGRVRPDVVVLTAYLLERATAADPMGAVETNILGVTNVFQAAVDLGLRRVVFASSGAVHGSSEDFQTKALD